MKKSAFSLHMISSEINGFITDKISQKRAKNTILFYQNQLNPWLEWCQVNGLVTVESITPVNLREFFIYIEKTHNNGGTHAFYRAIKAFLNWWDIEEEPENWRNPIKKITPPKRSREPIKGITNEEFEAVTAMCKTDYYGKRDRAILGFLFDTGVRVSELCNIHINEVDFQSGIVLVKITKNSKPRYVFMGAKCRKDVNRYLRMKEYKVTDYLFTQDNGKQLQREAIGDICEKYAIMAGLPSRPSPHDYRRAWFHNTLKMKVDPVTAARVGGHSDTSLLWTYNYQTAKDLQEAIAGSSPLDNL